MKRILIKNLKKYIGKKIKVAGWASIIRNQGSIKFIILRDITGIIQTVITKDNKEAFGITDSLGLESVIEIEGIVKKENQAPNGFEVGVQKIKLLSSAIPELPIPLSEKGGKETSLQKRLDWRFIDLRKPKNALMFKVWTGMEEYFREYCIKNNYIEIHSPKITGVATESGAEVFEVKYFNRKAYLAQSPQFYKQMAMASGFEKVFESGPVFRAEPSFTSRHSTEFTMYDMEISFIDSHQDIIDELAQAITYLIQKINKKFGKDIKKNYDREIIVPKLPFPQVTMAGAKEILAKLKIPSEKIGDLSPEEEKKLSEYIKKEKDHEFVFVTDYPVSVRPFYHMKLEKNSKLTKSFDLLWNGIEISTGAQREHRYDFLAKQAKEKGINIASIDFYLNFFKYGCPPHGGLGIGPARMIMKILNIENIREATFIFRGVKRLFP